jgi:phosphoglycolate phosphatase
MSDVLLICDLDGTLIDSFFGIAAALRQACASVGIEPMVPLDRSLVGPPLDELLKKVAGPVDPETLARLHLAFVESYDGAACCLSRPFDGIPEMLETVAERGHEMALATNKRLIPTLKILQHLRWQQLFRTIETADSQPGRLRSKSEMLADIRRGSCHDIRSFFYLGDTEADSLAAREVGMQCILAEWGYGVASGISADFKASVPGVVCGLL